MFDSQDRLVRESLETVELFVGVGLVSQGTTYH